MDKVAVSSKGLKNSTSNFFFVGEVIGSSLHLY